VRRDAGASGAGRDIDARTFRLQQPTGRSVIMSRFVAPLTFTMAAAWVVIVFVLVHGNS
jgi:hypothetical protein